MTRARRWFGTDGIRGTANVEPITVETMVRVGQALGHWTRSALRGQRRVVIGRDTRRSGDMLESAVAAGLCAAGAEVLLAGLLPTPAVALLTRRLGAAAGVVVSASHNPAGDNGVKLFAGDGFKLSDDAEAEIEATLLAAADHAPALPTGSGIGTVTRVEDASGRYVDAVVGTVPTSAALRGVRIVLDCAHGATYRVAPEIFRALGAAVTTIGAAPDGDNINRDAGALHTAAMQARVVAEGAQIGMAFDG
ncbi:phosphoglucosamine mutase, partial [Candidatus Binatia bacterium]|nr:phosphoglucosamine mutase [Candidatus Binatia bacterium]